MTDTRLHADALRADPRLAQGQALIAAAVADHCSVISGIRPPREKLRADYQQTLADFSRERGGSLYYNYLGSGLGNGALVELADGSVKYDMITGIGVHPFGHNDPDLLAALLDAAVSDTVMQGNLQQNVESHELCRELLELATAGGAPLAHCFLSTSGAMANENALKLLLQKKSPACRLLAFEHAFAGRTLALSAVTDKAAYRAGLPTPLAVDYVPFFDAAHPETSPAATLEHLRRHVDRYPAAHAGMIVEPIQGEGGYNVASQEFLQGLCSELRRLEIPIWFDEIQTFGRTTQPFAFQHFGLHEFADVVTIGKMTQVCATLFRDDFTPRPGLISQTFTGATSSIFAARRMLRKLTGGGCFGPTGKIVRVHARFVERFEEIRSRRPERFRGPWGLGGMVAFTAYEGDAKRSGEFLHRLFDAGVIAFLAGANPTRIRMLPPFGVITEDQIDEVCGIVENTLSSG